MRHATIIALCLLAHGALAQQQPASKPEQKRDDLDVTMQIIVDPDAKLPDEVVRRIPLPERKSTAQQPAASPGKQDDRPGRADDKPGQEKDQERAREAQELGREVGQSAKERAKEAAEEREQARRAEAEERRRNRDDRGPPEDPPGRPPGRPPRD